MSIQKDQLRREYYEAVRQLKVQCQMYMAYCEEDMSDDELIEHLNDVGLAAHKVLKIFED